MFTTKEELANQLKSEGWKDFILEYIPRGVMTDTYRLKFNKKTYAVRCYPNFRSWLAKIEYDYLEAFVKNGIKAPVPFTYCNKKGCISYIIYYWVEGETLKDKQEKLSDEQINTICDEVVENYRQISEIKTTKYGRVAEGGIFNYDSWKRFLQSEIEQSRLFFKHEQDEVNCEICDGLYEYAEQIPKSSPCLVWSDFSLDNIIISEDNKLAAFIDFEGLMSGDPLLGISYLLSQDGNSRIKRCILQKYGLYENLEHRKHLDFYSVFRYIRLAPYAKIPTPNNSPRDKIDNFLHYASTVKCNFKKHVDCTERMKRWLRIMKKKLTILIITALLSFMAIVGACCFYEPTLQSSQVSVINKDAANIEIVGDTPSWFFKSGSTFKSYKMIDDTDKKLLKSYVVVNDSVINSASYKAYINAIDELAFKSNTIFPNSSSLFLLTFCLVFLGCSARTFYDYIGWECYKNGQDMDTWWPWYVCRPAIGAPIATFLIVAFRTTMFSTLFSSRDLNSYLVVSFIAGFAMMEFLKMLRRSSKALFGEDK